MTTARTVGAQGFDLSVGEARFLPLTVIRPNAFNPNVQSDWMFEKELASIREFGFVVPVVVRQVQWLKTAGGAASEWEIIDGEHRWKAAGQLGFTEIPTWDLGEVEDDTARQLTIVLNETKGRADEGKLQALLADLLSRRPEAELRAVMPFPRERFDELTNRRQIDWGAMEEQRKELKESSETRWKELVYRMPYEAAIVVERAIERMMEREGLNHSWQAIEMWAADYESGP